MKLFAKLFSLFVALTITNNLSAQFVKMKVGTNFSTIHLKDNKPVTYDYKTNFGFHIGVTKEYFIGNNFSIEAGFLLSSKGFTNSYTKTENNITIDMHNEVNPLYAEIPLTSKILLDIGNIRVYGELGPYLGIGFFGDKISKFAINGSTTKDEGSISWGSDKIDSDLKSLDYGLIMGAGVMISDFQIGLSYELGIANISPVTDNGAGFSNRVLGFSVCYTLNN